VSEGRVVVGVAELGKVDESVLVLPLGGLNFGSGDHIEYDLGGWLGWRRGVVVRRGWNCFQCCKTTKGWGTL
jgi:hypothetical protein